MYATPNNTFCVLPRRFSYPVMGDPSKGDKGKDTKRSDKSDKSHPDRKTSDVGKNKCVTVQDVASPAPGTSSRNVNLFFSH